MKKFDKSPHTIIIHCTDTFVSMEFDEKWIKQIHLARGFDDIGYHFLVMPNGEIRVGRSIEFIGAHTLGFNSTSIGVAYVGGRSVNGHCEDTRTRLQKVSLASLMVVLAHQIPTLKYIRGHNDFTKQKTCPNFDVKKQYQSFFDDVLSDLDVFGRIIIPFTNLK